MPSRLRNGSTISPALAERVRAILDSQELTLYQVSQQSADLHGRSSPYFLPHNLYYDLQGGSFRPSIHQIYALSVISGYRVIDWLRVFGYDVEDITRLQVLLPSKRTVVLDTSLTDPHAWSSWFESRPEVAPTSRIVPLAKLLKAAPARRISSLKDLFAPRFLYAKVGREDALAFPVLIPGSIVRVNPDIADTNDLARSSISDRIFLVEHSKGFCCCRIRILDNGAIVPTDNGLRHASVELRRPYEAKLWGIVDLEFRPVWGMEKPEVPRELARRWKPQPLSSNENFGQLLKSTRKRRNLSVREAARMSRTIAELLKDNQYAASPSSLSDYELRNAAPRDFHKIITLCSIYCLRFESVMERIGVDVADAGTELIPDCFLPQTGPSTIATSADAGASRTGFLEQTLEDVREVPFFLRHCLGYFSGSPQVSLDDFFWVGGDDDPLHPYLEKGLVVMVNRRRKTPLHHVSRPLWQQPIYVVLKRDGTHFAACCGVEHGALVVLPFTRDFHPHEEYRLGQDAEIVGQVVAIARRLGSPRSLLPREI